MIMGISWVQILIVIALLLVLFGRGRISSLMGDIASGITSFRKGLRDGGKELDDAPPASQVPPKLDADNTDPDAKE